MSDEFVDTAENFTPLHGADNRELDTKFTAQPRVFDGRKLAPYSYGAEGAIDEALVGIQSDALWALTFLQVLGDLQAGFDKYSKDGWENADPTKGRATALGADAATDAAVADVFRALHGDLPLFQARANRLRAKIRRKGVEAAIGLVKEIVDEFKKTELMSADGEGDRPGK